MTGGVGAYNDYASIHAYWVDTTNMGEQPSSLPPPVNVPFCMPASLLIDILDMCVYVRACMLTFSSARTS